MAHINYAAMSDNVLTTIHLNAESNEFRLRLLAEKAKVIQNLP